MPRPPVVRAELREGGAMELLRKLELEHITGLLRFESDVESGELSLYGGEIAVEQAPRQDGRDPVDVLLGLAAGHYEVHQRLPLLAVSKGDDYAKTGSLAVHVPADLMTYCEHAGLSGVLELSNEGHRAEAVYDAGELLAIELDGRGDVDLSEVFAWEQGRFRIELDLARVGRIPEAAPATDDVPPPRKREDTRQFLRVVEMALVDVLDQSERARSPTRTSPPLPEGPKARPRVAAVPESPKRRPDELTVRLIYLGGDAPDPSDDSSTRHVHRGQAERVLTEARPERRASDSPEPESMAKKKKNKNHVAKTDANDAEQPASQPEPEGAPAGADAGADAAAEAAAAPGPESSEVQAAEAATADLDAPRPERPAGPPANPLAALGWALGFVLVALVILAVLARLPPVQ